MIHRLALEFDVPAHVVAGVFRDVDFSFTLLALIAVTVYRISERARRTLPNDIDNFFRRISIRSYEWFAFVVKHARQVIGAIPKMATRAAVVKNGNPGGSVGVEPVRRTM